MTPAQRYIHEHRSLAHHFARKWRGLLEDDDLCACGDVGLCESARDFDAGRGVDFTSFLFGRVRRVVLEEVRRVYGRPGHGQRVTLVFADPADIDMPEPPPIDRARLMDLRAQLVALPERERLALLMQTAGYSLDDIAARLGGVTISRASQLAAKARTRLTA